MNFSGKTVLVVGGSSGIGRATSVISPILAQEFLQLEEQKRI